MKDLLRIADLNPADLELLLDEAALTAADPQQHAGLLRGDAVALSFAKPATRTRLAVQTAVTHLGAMPLDVSPDELQATGAVRAILAGGFADADVRAVAAAAEVLDGPRSLVRDQAANLPPVIEAVLYLLLAGRLQGHADALPVPDDTAPLAAALTAAVRSAAAR